MDETVRDDSHLAFGIVSSWIWVTVARASGQFRPDLNYFRVRRKEAKQAVNTRKS